MEDLMKSLERKGMQQPVCVMQLSDEGDRKVMVNGFKRFKAYCRLQELQMNAETAKQKGYQLSPVQRLSDKQIRTIKKLIDTPIPVILREGTASNAHEWAYLLLENQATSQPLTSSDRRQLAWQVKISEGISKFRDQGGRTGEQIFTASSLMLTNMNKTLTILGNGDKEHGAQVARQKYPKWSNTIMATIRHQHKLRQE